MEMPPPPPPPLPPGTTVMSMDVGSGRYSVVVTYGLEMAAAWVRELPLLEPSPPVNRIIGLSFLWSDFTTNSGLRFLDSITFSFFSRVLVLQLPLPGDSFPEDLRSFLVNPRNLFAGVGVGLASRVMESLYGVGLPRRMELDRLTAVGMGEPHLVLARCLLGWTSELTGGWPMFAVETSVLSQLLGHFITQHNHFPVPGNIPWF